MARTNAERALLLSQRIQAQVVRSAGKGLLAAAVFLSARVKETLSEPAPRRKLPGTGGYVAKTRALAGMPPRKLSGRLRGSVFRKQISATEVVVGTNAKSDKGWNYPKHHEMKRPGHPQSGKHPFILPTAIRYRKELALIVGQEVVAGFRRAAP